DGLAGRSAGRVDEDRDERAVGQPAVLPVRQRTEVGLVGGKRLAEAEVRHRTPPRGLGPARRRRSRLSGNTPNGGGAGNSTHRTSRPSRRTLHRRHTYFLAQGFGFPNPLPL